MLNLNRVQLIGYMAAKPKLFTQEGKAPFATASVATHETTKREGKEVSDTQWHQLIFFGKAAQTVEKLLDKGMQVYLEGRLKNNHWEDKAQQKRITTNILVKRFHILESSAKQGGEDPDAGDVSDSRNATAINHLGEMRSMLVQN